MESGQNCCFSLSHIFLSWLLILTKKYVISTLDIKNVLAYQISLYLFLEATISLLVLTLLYSMIPRERVMQKFPKKISNSRNVNNCNMSIGFFFSIRYRWNVIPLKVDLRNKKILFNSNFTNFGKKNPTLLSQLLMLSGFWEFVGNIHMCGGRDFERPISRNSKIANVKSDERSSYLIFTFPSHTEYVKRESIVLFTKWCYHFFFSYLNTQILVFSNFNAPIFYNLPNLFFFLIFQFFFNL